MLDVIREIGEAVQEEVDVLVGTQKGGEVVGRGAYGHPTKRIDRVAEETVLRGLGEAGLSVIVHSEESGRVSVGEDPELFCFLDPLDGTFNALRSIPFYAFSISFGDLGGGESSEVHTALIRDLARGDVYEAVRGRGAKWKGEVLSASRKRKLEKGAFSLYAEGRSLEVCLPLIQRVRRVRALGSVSLELAYVSRGAYDGFVDLREPLRTTDVAAGVLLCREAGGVATDLQGEPFHAGIGDEGKSSLIAAGNPWLHRKILTSMEERS